MHGWTSNNLFLKIVCGNVKLFYNDLIVLLNSLRSVTMVVILPAKGRGGGRHQMHVVSMSNTKMKTHLCSVMRLVQYFLVILKNNGSNRAHWVGMMTIMVISWVSLMAEISQGAVLNR
jgi:hypothetical protein